MEEEYEASREKLNPVVQCVHAEQDVEVKQAEIQRLKSKIKGVLSCG